MHIQLLPSVRPTERPYSSGVPRVEFHHGQRVSATVLAPDLDGRARLAFGGGREAASSTPLPFAPGTRLLLEVIEASTDEPHLRIVEPDLAPPPPVSPESYGYAAAVLAARTASDRLPAVAALLQWLPLLMARGLLTSAQAATIWRDLGPVGGRTPSAEGTAATGASNAVPPGDGDHQELAEALASRLARDPSLLEARLAQLHRQGCDASALLAGDVRTQLARLALALSDPARDASTQGALAAVERAQAALLADQARVAGHLARDGVIDLRLPVAVDGRNIDLRMRVGDAPERDRAAEGGRGARRVQLDLTLAGLGRVQVRLDATGPHLRAELITTHGTAADALELNLSELTAALGAAGFSEIFTRVVIDPVRVTASDAPLDLPPDGSIVNVEA